MLERYKRPLQLGRSSSHCGLAVPAACLLAAFALKDWKWALPGLLGVGLLMAALEFPHHVGSCPTLRRLTRSKAPEPFVQDRQAKTDRHDYQQQSEGARVGLSFTLGHCQNHSRFEGKIPFRPRKRRGVEEVTRMGSPLVAPADCSTTWCECCSEPQRNRTVGEAMRTPGSITPEKSPRLGRLVFRKPH